MYVITESICGVPNVGTVTVISAMSLPNNKCVAWLNADDARNDWTVITEEEYNAIIDLESKAIIETGEPK